MINIHLHTYLHHNIPQSTVIIQPSYNCNTICKEVIITQNTQLSCNLLTRGMYGIPRAYSDHTALSAIARQLIDIHLHTYLHRKSVCTQLQRGDTRTSYNHVITQHSCNFKNTAYTAKYYNFACIQCAYNNHATILQLQHSCNTICKEIDTTTYSYIT